jgi:hypothetical protein
MKRRNAERGRRASRFSGFAIGVALAVAATLGLPSAGMAASSGPMAAGVATDGNGRAARQPVARQFALIVNGDDAFTHNMNVALALTALPRLGYAPADTFALAPAAGVANAAEDTDGNGRGGTAGAASVWRRDASDEGLRQAVSSLRERLRPGDVLLVYLTGHAYRAFGHTVLGLRHGSISANDLLQRIAVLPFGKLILIADPCYSGGFVTAAVALGRNVVAVSSTDEHHEVRCEPFVRPLWLAAMTPATDAAGTPSGSEPGPGDAADGSTSSVAVAANRGSASVEAAFQTTAAIRRAAGDAPQYAATGSCAGHANSFAGIAADSIATAATAATSSPIAKGGK